MTDECLDDLIRTGYDVAGSREGWAIFLKAYAETMGADTALLAHHTPASAGVRLDITYGVEPEWATAYISHYSKIYPYEQAIVNLRVGECELQSSLPANCENPRESEFYIDFVLPQQRRLEGSVAKLFHEPRLMSGLALHVRSDRHPETLLRTLPLQRRVIPHVQAALRLHHRMLELQRDNDDLSFAMETTALAAVLCDATGRVRRANPAAEQLMCRRDGLEYAGGCLRAIDKGENARLQQALLEAGTREKGSIGPPRGPLLASRPGHRSPYELLVVPVPRLQSALLEGGGRVLVFLHDPETVRKPSDALLRQLHGLTPREARIAQLLAMGLTTAEIANRLRITRETLKSHLRATYLKTGARRQTELVARILSGLASLNLQEEHDD